MIEEQEEKTIFDTKYKLFLTEKDEYVPATHVGMYSLFRNPENTSVYMSESVCQSIRYKTYTKTMELFKKYQTPSFCTFFNYNSDILTALGVNYFATSDKFAPIAELVECFPQKVETDSVPAQAISFGIDKIVLKEYLKSLHDGTDFWSSPPISVMKRKKLQQQKRDFIMFDGDDTQLDYWSSIHMPRNPLYHRFLDWCKLQGIESYEGMLMAIEMLLYAYPLEDLKDLTEYDYIDELDVPLYAKPRELSKKIERTVIFSGQICSLADKIIERYNREPKNIAKRIDFDLYCNNALYLLNQNMDIEYRDPALYDETAMMDESEAYNKELLAKTQDGMISKKYRKKLPRKGKANNEI